MGPCIWRVNLGLEGNRPVAAGANDFKTCPSTSRMTYDLSVVAGLDYHDLLSCRFSLYTPEPEGPDLKVGLWKSVVGMEN